MSCLAARTTASSARLFSGFAARIRASRLLSRRNARFAMLFRKLRWRRLEDALAERVQHQRLRNARGVAPMRRRGANVRFACERGVEIRQADRLPNAQVACDDA